MISHHYLLIEAISFMILDAPHPQHDQGVQIWRHWILVRANRCNIMPCVLTDEVFEFISSVIWVFFKVMIYMITSKFLCVWTTWWLSKVSRLLGYYEDRRFCGLERGPATYFYDCFQGMERLILTLKVHRNQTSTNVAKRTPIMRLFITASLRSSFQPC